MIRFDIVTIFPDIIKAYTSESIISRAIEKGAVEIHVHNLRDWATDKHKTIDDRVYGGGPGMLMKIEPLYAAITDIKSQIPEELRKHTKVGLTSPSGTLLTQNFAEAIIQESNSHGASYILLCGHYEGIDYRIHEFVDFSFSVGPVILTGGELPSLLFIDVVTRLIPGVLGNEASPKKETTFTITNNVLNITGEYPQYTRPDSFTYTNSKGEEKELKVPDVLTSGDHAKIDSHNAGSVVESEQNVTD